MTQYDPLWKCPACGSHGHARCDEKQADGSYAPGTTRRCVHCKRTFQMTQDAELKAAVEAFEEFLQVNRLVGLGFTRNGCILNWEQFDTLLALAQRPPVEVDREAIARELRRHRFERTGRGAAFDPQMAATEQELQDADFFIALLPPAKPEVEERPKRIAYILAAIPQPWRGLIEALDDDKRSAEARAKVLENLSENLLIAIGMNWDLEGVISELRAALTKEPT